VVAGLCRSGVALIFLVYGTVFGHAAHWTFPAAQRAQAAGEIKAAIGHSFGAAAAAPPGRSGAALRSQPVNEAILAGSASAG
jgi:hypothetical protein